MVRTRKWGGLSGISEKEGKRLAIVVQGGTEIVGAATFLEIAAKADVTLFI